MPATASGETCLDLDLSGKFCPQVVLEVADAVRGQPAGTRLRITSTDPLSLIDIPLFARKNDHALDILARGEERCLFLLTIRAHAGATP